MTQPYQPQQYAPQYQPPAPQQYAPQGFPGAVVTYPQPPAQQQYAPAPQQSAPSVPQGPQQGQGLMPSTPKLGDGGGGGGGTVSPKLRHLDGRTIVVLPHRVDEDAIDPNTKMKRPEAYFDLIVVDGGPVRYGDNIDDRNPEKNRPNTHEIDTPCMFVGASDIGGAFVSCVRDALAAGEPGRAGVIERGTKGFRPYLITRCGEHVDRSTRAGGDAKYAEAMRMFDLVWQDRHDRSGAPKRFVSPEPRSLVAPPPAAAAQPQVAYGAPQQPAYAPQGYAPAPQGAYLPTAGAYGVNNGGLPTPGGYQSPAPAGYAAQQYAQTGTVPTPYGAAPAAELHPQYVAAATQPQWSGPGAQMLGQELGMQAPQYVAAPNEPALPPPVEAWLASLPEGQRAVSRAQYIAQMMGAQGAPQQPQPTGPGM